MYGISVGHHISLSSHLDIYNKKTFNVKNFFNLGTISAITAIVIYLIDISLPEVIAEPIKLAGFSIRELIKEKWAVIFTIIRLFILPTIIWYIGRFFITDKLLLGVLIIISGMSVASNIVMMSNEYGGDQDFITKGVFFNIIFCCINTNYCSITLIIYKY